MKFLCVACDEAMQFVEAAEASRGDTLTAVFGCPRCAARWRCSPIRGRRSWCAAWVVSIGGRTAAHEPLEVVRARLAESRLLWTDDAEQRLARVPEFVRPMVRERVERHARERGCREVTCEVMDEVKSSMRM